MKSNPYLSALVALSLFFLAIAFIAFIVSLIASNLPGGAASVVGSGVVLGLTLPAGAAAFLLWLTACAIVWRPSDEPKRVAGRADWGDD